MFRTCTRIVDPEEVIPPKRKAVMIELTMVPGRVIRSAPGMIRHF